MGGGWSLLSFSVNVLKARELYTQKRGKCHVMYISPQLKTTTGSSPSTTIAETTGLCPGEDGGWA